MPLYTRSARQAIGEESWPEVESVKEILASWADGVGGRNPSCGRGGRTAFYNLIRETSKRAGVEEVGLLRWIDGVCGKVKGFPCCEACAHRWPDRGMGLSNRKGRRRVVRYQQYHSGGNLELSLSN